MGLMILEFLTHFFPPLAKSSFRTHGADAVRQHLFHGGSGGDPSKFSASKCVQEHFGMPLRDLRTNLATLTDRWVLNTMCAHSLNDVNVHLRR
jgi:hypothetical protein